MTSAGLPPRERAINLPLPLTGAIALLLAVHAYRTWLDAEADLHMLFALSFTPASWSVATGWARPDDILTSAAEAGADPDTASVRLALARFVLAEGWRPWSWLTYSIVHGSWSHVLLNSVWLAAFGSSVLRRAGGARALVLAAVTSAGGALAQWVSDPASVQPVIGASAIVSGFMAAAATFIFERRHPVWWGAPAARTRWGYLRNRQAVLFLGSWFALNLLFGVLAVPLGLSEAGIAWQAHIGGLLAGLLAFPLLDRQPPADPPAPHP